MVAGCLFLHREFPVESPTRLIALFALLLSLGAPAVAQESETADAGNGSGEEDAEWSVSDAPGYDATVTIDTRETTWSEVTVSPDGETLVFDMLGDLYRVPVGGGEAEALTAGIEWNHQPRFSPDGESIAFISDRDGAENLWVMDADGGNPRAVSSESEHILHTPNWSPDGEYLVARKSFMSTRSIAAGEIWMFHAAGGQGVQLVERPLGARDQKNIAEPAYSPDGRYVYYSQDLWPGDSWEYNKDPTRGIFAIRRLDLETGETRTVVSGPGGAIRPTPSPDGKALAYVTREPGLRSALMLKDLESGIQRTLYSGLDRDLQETNGTLGNTPAFAWMPGGEAIVFWAGGRFHRIDVASGEVAQIPVHVRAQKKVRPALRFPVEVAPEAFDIHMARWAQRTPDGKSAVFQALGRIWVQDLESGERRALTRADDRLEYYPVVSPDGRRVAFTTWDDEDLGSVRVVGLNGRGEKAITTEPGHYIEPAFSPDGERLAWRKIAGGYLLSPTWSERAGLYVADLDGGEPRRVTDSGREPHFGGRNDRLYYLGSTGELGTELELRSVDLDGDDERTHLHAQKATTFRVSPDGRWVAFVYQFNAWIAPFTAAGGRVTIGPDSKALPVRQVSARAGDFLAWSADSDALEWSHGPVLYRRDLADAFAFVDGAPAELPEPVTDGVNLAFSVPTDRPEGTLALVGGRVVTMRDADAREEIIEDGVVVIEGNRIVAVGPRGEVDLPRGAEVVDVSGKTVLPGLVDPHAHGGFGREEILPEQNWMQYSNLSFGVTTIHDPSNDTSEVFAAADLQKAGRMVAPRIYSTGRILYGAYAPGATAKIASLEDAEYHVRRLSQAGAISVKSYNQPRRAARQQVFEAAAELGVMVFPEGGAKYQHNMSMIVDGHTGIEHALPIKDIYDDTVQLWSQTQVGYTPTFGVAYGGLSGETYWYDRTEVWKNERLDAFTPDQVILPASLRRTTAPDSEYNHFGVAAHAKRLRDAGVRVNIGAHGQREGLAAHWELWMLAQGGFSPWEAWRAGSWDGAHYLGMAADLGSIEVGKLADLVVVDGDPMADIRQSERVSHTVANGRLYDAATMNPLWPEAVEREKFFFERPGGDAWQPAAMEAWEAKARRHHWRH